MYRIKPNIFLFYKLLILLVYNLSSVVSFSETKFKIDGKVSVSSALDSTWVTTSKVLVDGGLYLGFLKSDGSFTVNNLPSGSYLVEIASPTYVFEPIRVDINSKGKFRARRLNNLQPNAVSTLPYPLRFKSLGKANYFQAREQWRITDILMNPMILMMVLPFLLLMVLPKLINSADPEAQKEMESQMNMLTPNSNLPDFSEMITNFLGGEQKKAVKSKDSKRDRKR